MLFRYLSAFGGFFFCLFSGLELSVAFFSPCIIFFLSGLFPNIIGVGAMGATSFVSFSFSCCIWRGVFFFFCFRLCPSLVCSRVSLALYPAETTLVSQFLSLLFSLGVLRSQILPTVGCGLCGGGGGGDNGIGLVGGCVDS